MPDIAIDSTLWAALVSAVVAFLVLTLDRFIIEPRKWRSRYEIKSTERALEIHGWLVSVLRACQEKARRQPEGQTLNIASHLLESSDIWTLEEIFGKKAYMLSECLKQTWYDLQRKDTYFAIMRTKHREDWSFATPAFRTGMKHELLTEDLSRMQEQAETDFSELQSRYTKLTGFKPVSGGSLSSSNAQ